MMDYGTFSYPGFYSWLYGPNAQQGAYCRKSQKKRRQLARQTKRRKKGGKRK